MYEPSRQIASFFIAGFQHHDGAEALARLEPGCSLDIEFERDNPHDPDAVAISFEGLKLGYVPKEETSLMSLVAFYGHEGVFEIVVLQVDSREAPWKQVRVGLRVRDARKDS